MRSSLLAPIAAALVVSTPAAAPPHTVSDFANVMAAAATRLDGAVGARQQVGDMAAAQRLALAAAMVRRAGEEFRSAEQEALTDEAVGLGRRSRSASPRRSRSPSRPPSALASRASWSTRKARSTR